MHTVQFIQDLAIIMLIAGFVTVLFHRLKQPVVLGYIVAGLIIGPYTPPFAFISDENTIKTLAELGVVFLMFSLGLEFSLRKLARVGITALVAALFEIIIMIWIGYEIGRFYVWSLLNSLFLGANFIVRWSAEREMNSPIIECLMIGTQSGQGISFVSSGKVIKEHTR